MVWGTPAEKRSFESGVLNVATSSSSMPTDGGAGWATARVVTLQDGQVQ